jgi:HJR/Mrr/RecB family endonuclease
MDMFYIVVSSIAIIILILILTVIGLMMKNQNHMDVYPPFQSPCPDYWAVNQDGTCSQSSINRLPATYNKTVAVYNNALNKIVVTGDIASYRFDFSGNSLCDNKKWANTYKLEWDGVSNSIAPC